ncbi:MAG: hypothetical protein IPK07_13045 [Deltaproteobacteria bacterium]|nr:hypothetical protein [Deltaproteobacteria bacterium]
MPRFIAMAPRNTIAIPSTRRVSRGAANQRSPRISPSASPKSGSTIISTVSMSSGNCELWMRCAA